MRAAMPVLAVVFSLAATAVLAAPAAPPAAPDTAAAAKQPPDAVLRRKIVGSWGQSPACAKGRLTFNADGTFTSKGAEQASGVTGTYAIDGGELSGRHGDNTMPVMLVSFDGDSLLLDDGSGKPERLARCRTQ